MGFRPAQRGQGSSAVSAQAWRNTLEPHSGPGAGDTELDENRPHWLVRTPSPRNTLYRRETAPRTFRCTGWVSPCDSWHTTRQGEKVPEEGSGPRGLKAVRPMSTRAADTLPWDPLRKQSPGDRGILPIAWRPRTQAGRRVGLPGASLSTGRAASGGRRAVVLPADSAPRSLSSGSCLTPLQVSAPRREGRCLISPALARLGVGQGYLR